MKRSVQMVTVSVAAFVLSGAVLAQHNTTVSPHTIKVPKYSHATIKVSKISHSIKVARILRPIKVAKPSQYRPLVHSSARK